MKKDKILNFKLFVFNNIPILENIYAYNRKRRRLWIERHSRSISDNSKVLDVGAGGCPHKKYFQHCDYYSQDFVQLSPSQIQNSEGYGKIDFVSDIVNIPVKDNSFDLILCTEVIEHVPEPILAIKEISRILKPGGILLITAPLQSGLHQEPYHFYGGYTRYWYEKFLTDNGFSEITIEPNGSLHTTYFALGLTMFKGFLDSLVNRDSLIKKFISLISLILFSPFFLVFNPLFCFFWEKYYRLDGFTAGYHVKACKM